MTTFDVIGSIAVLHLNRVRKQDKKFADTLLKKHKNIKSVYNQSKISGRLRTPKLKWVSGKKQTETIHRESGCMMKLDIERCYFSPRLGTDRLNIAKKVKRGEKVLVMFSGVAPYALVISRHSKAKEIYCAEISRTASKYARENIKLNKLKNIKVIQGDVKKVIPKLKLKFDRIVMARPQLKEIFLKQAFKVSKSGTIIHFYDFLKRQDLSKAREKIEKEAKKAKKKIKIQRVKKVREIAPYKYHVRVDFKIL